jgi:plasmid stabilization system protein ParE
MDKYQIMITPTAKDDLIDIGDYISFILLEPETSEKCIRGLRRSISQLQYFPNKFPIIQDYILKYRNIHYMPYKNYFVFYQVDDEKSSYSSCWA